MPLSHVLSFVLYLLCIFFWLLDAQNFVSIIFWNFFSTEVPGLVTGARMFSCVTGNSEQKVWVFSINTVNYNLICWLLTAFFISGVQDFVCVCCRNF
jgi:hypothetical protein